MNNTCAKCEQVHTKCRAHNRAGGPCGRPPKRGLAVCNLHGGKSPNALRAAKRAADKETARKQLVVLGEPIAVDPGAALLGLVHAKAGEVAWLRILVRDVVFRADDGQELAEPDDQRLVWGMTRQKIGGDDAGTTEEAKPHVLWVMLRECERDLASYCTAALKAGIEERRVRLAEDQGLLVAQVMRAVLGEMYDATILALRALGLSSDEISDAMRQAWEKATQVVVPRELRRLEGGSPS